MDAELKQKLDAIHRETKDKGHAFIIIVLIFLSLLVWAVGEDASSFHKQVDKKLDRIEHKLDACTAKR